MITNPILPGFNPDPSFLRVGDDYYIATSTFEWFPGVQIHHSKDLVHWRLLTRPLDRISQLDMTGVNSSCGAWAPALSYADNRFWLVYTNVQSCRGGSWMNTPNYVVTAESIEGPWSDPVYLNSSGFDPSLFHDDDGKKYLLNMIWDGRKNRGAFAGIALQEFDATSMQFVGESTVIFKGTELGCTEGPFLLKKDGWYYLITAEGGTGFHHGVTVCRSKDIRGPYDVHPHNPILTSRGTDNQLQRAGHGFMQETVNGEWYLTHLCGRPLYDPARTDNSSADELGFCILGRETAIQKIVWSADGWPRLAGGGNAPQFVVDPPNLPQHLWPHEDLNDMFDGPTLNKHFQTLREPVDESWCSLTERKGFLRLRGRHSLYSNFKQSLVARRVQSFSMVTETCLEFVPENIQQMAGLIVYYNTTCYYYLRVTLNDAGEKVLGIIYSVDEEYDEYDDSEVLIKGSNKVYLRVELDYQWYQFSYSTDGVTYAPIGPKLNSTKLSDEAGDVFRFTGTFVGLSAIDVSGAMIPADFEWFKYKEL